MIIFKKKLKIVSTETFCTNNLKSTVLTNYYKTTMSDNLDEQEILDKFFKFMEDFDTRLEKDFEPYWQNKDPKYLRVLKEKYSHLKRTKKITKKDDFKPPYVQELLEIYDMVDSNNNRIFTTHEERKLIYKYCVNKIRGLFKHAQALKTGYCNLQIISGFSEANTITWCITKNTLEANEQWLTRLFKELDNRFPSVKLNDKIMIISSEPNTLNGNATHCKNCNEAWGKLKRNNSFKVIFVCSNKVRINDILEMCKDFQNLRAPLQKNIRVLHDEAHNPNEGIPAYRDIIENIILQPNVLSYTPVSASNEPIFDETNNLWKKQNLEDNSLDYTAYDKTKSTDPNYSSCLDAERITFETLQHRSNWVNYRITKITREIFLKVHDKDFATIEKFTQNDIPKVKKELLKAIDLFEMDNIFSEDTFLDPYTNRQLIETYSIDELKNLIKEYIIERKRTLEFCGFMKNHKEIIALNTGLNCLNFNSILGFELFIASVFNLHIISTPCRNILTRHLAEEAIKKDYNPIVLAIYGDKNDKYHLLYDGNELEVSSIMESGEFNSKLNKLIKNLIFKGVNINRPFIIIGNYSPTGESITFVNYEYGIVRTNIRLVSTDAASDYQEGARGNYMITKFIENDPSWTPPTKYLIGSESFIQNCLSIEKENDERIDTLGINRQIDSTSTNTDTFQINPELLPSNNGNLFTSIPGPITIGDFDHPKVKVLTELRDIERKNPEQKKQMWRLLIECIEDPEINLSFTDKTGKLFNNEEQKFKEISLEYTIKNCRTYRNTEEENKSSWKFSSYKNHYLASTRFINESSKIGNFECDLLTCRDDYVEKDNLGTVKFRNFKNTWWLSYKYSV